MFFFETSLLDSERTETAALALLEEDPECVPKNERFLRQVQAATGSGMLPPYRARTDRVAPDGRVARIGPTMYRGPAGPD